jgi:predicted nucleic acid-binding protein
MIFLDANFLIRYSTQPETPEEAAMTTTASLLFDAIDRGEEEATTSEVVLHEVAYILASKKHLHLPTSLVVS